jgi:predicted dehydrogenase
VEKREPLQVEIASFLECVRNRTEPLVGANEGIRALEVSLSILAKIKEHLAIVAESIKKSPATSESPASS